MWVIKCLTGPQTGQIFDLKTGKTVIGRAPTCDIQLNNNGVSKQHAEFILYPDKLILSDLNSRNGTFVNGTRIQTMRVENGDNFTINDQIFAILNVPQHISIPTVRPAQYTSEQAQRGSFSEQSHSPQQIYAYQAQGNGFHQSPDQEDPDEMSNRQPQTLAMRVQSYFNEIVMPGIYHLASIMEYRSVLALFIGLMILLTTAFSVIPMAKITKESIQAESQRRAQTIAKQLALINQKPIAEGLDTAVTVVQAANEIGITSALVIAADGRIIAPVSKAGGASQHPFIAHALRQNQETLIQIDDNTVGASVPIKFYNAELNDQVVAAHAIVIYDMGSLALDSQRTLSLYLQTLLVALAFGGILFVFLYKLTLYPFEQINSQLDLALRDGDHDINLEFHQTQVQNLISGINTLLSRSQSAAHSGNLANQGSSDRLSEAQNLVNLVGAPAIAIQAHDQSIITVNAYFEQLTNTTLNDLRHQSISYLPDQALQANLEHLLTRVQTDPYSIAHDSLEFSGAKYEIQSQAIFSDSRISYIIVVFHPVFEEGAA